MNIQIDLNNYRNNVIYQIDWLFPKKQKILITLNMGINYTIFQKLSISKVADLNQISSINFCERMTKYGKQGSLFSILINVLR